MCATATETNVSEHTRCKNCGHAKYAHSVSALGECGECVACGCIPVRGTGEEGPGNSAALGGHREIRHGSRREVGQGAGAGGRNGRRIAKGLREVKAEVLKPRQQTFGTQINVVRVKGGC